MEIKFITWDEKTEGIAVEHDGTEVWADGPHDSWDQYFRHYMPKGVPVTLAQDTRPGEHEGQPPASPAVDIRVDYFIEGSLHGHGWVSYATLGPVTEQHAAEVYRGWQESRDNSEFETRYRLVRRTTADEIVCTEQAE